MKKKTMSLIQKIQVVPLGCLFWGLFLDHSFLVFTATHTEFLQSSFRQILTSEI